MSKEDTSLIFTAPCVQYGIHAFEGILSLNIKGNNFIFRLNEHVKRLLNSCEKLSITCALKEEEIIDKVKKYLSIIAPQEDCTVRVSIFPLEGTWSTPSLSGTLLISAFSNSTARLAGSKESLKLKIGNTIKPLKAAMDHSIKVGANYVNSRYAHLEAIKDDFDTCLLTNEQGDVTESGGSNIFFHTDKSLNTPLIDSNILAGITRDTILKISKYLEIDSKECIVKKDRLADYQGAFLCGTSMRIKPISQINGKIYPIDSKIFRNIKDTYNNILYLKSSYSFSKDWHTAI